MDFPRDFPRAEPEGNPEERMNNILYFLLIYQVGVVWVFLSHSGGSSLGFLVSLRWE